MIIVLIVALYAMLVLRTMWCFFTAGTTHNVGKHWGMWTAVQQELLPGRFVAEIVFCIMQNFSAEQIGIFAITLWSIWKQRNNNIWNNDSESRAVVCDWLGKCPRIQNFCHCTTAFETITLVKTSIRKIHIQW